MRLESRAKQKPLERDFEWLHGEVRGSEPAIPTKYYHIYPAYSFHFFAKGFCTIIRVKLLTVYFGGSSRIRLDKQQSGQASRAIRSHQEYRFPAIF